MKPALLLSRSEVDRLLALPDCITALEEMFRRQGEGKLPAAGILGVKCVGGALHIKAGFLPGTRNYVAAKLNTNFPRNPAEHRLPSVQGLITLFDGNDGRPLAVLDSIDITIKRTAAASAVAAKYLARPDSSVATICGCGQQAIAQLRAVRAVVPLKKIHAYDVNHSAARDLAEKLRDEFEIEPVRELEPALRKSDVCITCTPANEFYIRKNAVAPGAFIAAVGADDSHKQEIDPALIATAKVIADSLEQSCTIGDTHHAIAAGLMRKEDVHAELAEIVAGRKPGRTGADEITIFDSTGFALEDAVAAVAVYEKARLENNAAHFDFAA